MARAASNPLPEFITSPQLGIIVAAQLDEAGETFSKLATDNGGMSRVDARLVESLHVAADQIRRYHDRAGVR